MKPHYKNYYSNNKRFSMDKWKEKKEKIIDNTFNIENLKTFPYLNNNLENNNLENNNLENNNLENNIEENKKNWLEICNENKDKPIIEKKKINIIKNDIINEDNIIEDNELVKSKINKIKNILNDDGSITIVKKTKIKSNKKEIIELSDNNIYINQNSFLYKNIKNS
jgi:hypothetical protein